MKVTAGTDRREAIGDAGIAIVAREGLRSLTHRAIDRELGLPPGSTSYYARTRRQLIEAMVHRLASRTVSDMRPAATPQSGPATVEEAARGLAALIDQLALRPDDHRTRYALMVDLVNDPELRAWITTASPIRAGTLAAATDRLDRLGVPDPDRHAPGLVALIDGLLLDRVAGSGLDPADRPDAATLIAAYLRGLSAAGP